MNSPGDHSICVAISPKAGVHSQEDRNGMLPDHWHSVRTPLVTEKKIGTSLSFCILGESEWLMKRPNLGVEEDHLPALYHAGTVQHPPLTDRGRVIVQSPGGHGRASSVGYLFIPLQLVEITWSEGCLVPAEWSRFCPASF